MQAQAQHRYAQRLARGALLCGQASSLLRQSNVQLSSPRRHSRSVALRIASRGCLALDRVNAGREVFRNRRDVGTRSVGTVPSTSIALNPETTQQPTTNDSPTTLSPPAPSPPNTTETSSLANLRWKEAAPFHPSVYAGLTKMNLSALVTLTTMAGFAVAPGAAPVSTLLWTTLGTGLCIASANTINQWIEAPYDAQMARTRTRVLVRHAVSPHHAFAAGTLAGLAGVTTLAAFVNPIVAVLGGANILLYTCVYTPMKRTSIANTWAGAVVGAIPPMMGWAASTGGLEPGAWLMGAILYAWQFPHFNSLSWNLRPDYSKAGYRMMSVVDPALNGRVSLRYSLAMFPLCWAAPYLGLTSVCFAGTSTLINGYMAYGAYKFWRMPTEKSARFLFFGSVVHLPILLGLMMVHKARKGDEEDEEDDWYILSQFRKLTAYVNA
ncbi:Protoheme IX farnesyltransferase, mitochondrial [Rhizophlyctis rosea]|uniref:Protoheme IX farnesyltransferase, mitochondrial n=1 Tax=Rhizophlyctis rosea TaxID=64517 RepID=A0AAD5XAD2_9FUNG|nr:Protoheme IX farnesyltransferase, mitochondrial [Rhizophlyctis rosea]